MKKLIPLIWLVAISLISNMAHAETLMDKDDATLDANHYVWVVKDNGDSTYSDYKTQVSDIATVLGGSFLLIANIDDVPVDSETAAPISSNWAYDLINTTLPAAYQPLDTTELSPIAGLTSAANKGIRYTGSGTAALFDLTAAALTVLDDSTVEAMWATILPERAGAPASPTAGQPYFADGTSWDPSGLGISKGYYVVYDGSAYIPFMDEDGDWYFNKISGGINTYTDADGFTMSAAQAMGYQIYLTGAQTVVLAPAVDGVNFCASDEAGGAAMVLDPDASGTEDTIRLNGVAAAQGENIVSDSTAGSMICCSYFAADTWACYSDSHWAEASP